MVGERKAVLGAAGLGEGARPGRLVVASNRLPVVVEHDADGQLRARRGSGGLVSALLPIVSGHGSGAGFGRDMAGEGGLWVGWLGDVDSHGAGADAQGRQLSELALAQIEGELGCRLLPVPLSADEIDDYYQGFANEILWPLFHDQLNRCRFEPRYWQAYQQVNRKFARILAAHTDESDLIWIHDYHLLQVAAALRESGEVRRTAFFLHIPFPGPDLLATLPWRDALIDGLLAHGLVGFQTERDLGNFVQAVTRLRPGIRLEDREVAGARIRIAGSTVVAALPISIDFQGLVAAAARPEVTEVTAHLRNPCGRREPAPQLLLGVDRLDYSKGIPQRLAAYARLLDDHPELHGRVGLVQIVVPSRAKIPAYQALEREIEGLVGAINGRYWRPGWTPVEYAYRSLGRAELLGFYRAADVALVTPVKDGMNLVCKEYCAARLDEDGVLVLSEFAGAATQLGEHAILVNPHDVEGTAAALHRALTMPMSLRRQHMRALRRSIAEADIFTWVRRFFSLVPQVDAPERFPRGPERRPPTSPTMPPRPSHGREVAAK